VSGAGRSRLVGVETKYTEPFSPTEYDKPSYRTVTNRASSWFMPNAAPQARRSATNQLWRNLMLAQESATDLAVNGAVMVLTAAKDPGAASAVAGISAVLKDPPQHLAHVLLEDLMAAAEQEPTLAAWAQRFYDRYLRLELARVPAA